MASFDSGCKTCGELATLRTALAASEKALAAEKAQREIETRRADANFEDYEAEKQKLREAQAWGEAMFQSLKSDDPDDSPSHAKYCEAVVHPSYDPPRQCDCWFGRFLKAYESGAASALSSLKAEIRREAFEEAANTMAPADACNPPEFLPHRIREIFEAKANSLSELRAEIRREAFEEAAEQCRKIGKLESGSLLGLAADFEAKAKECQ